MEDAERIQSIERQCRAYQYPEPLVTAIIDYLSGQGSLEQVQQAWQADTVQRHPSALFAHAPGEGQSLGQLDQRLIDLASLTGQLPWWFQALGWQGPVEQLRDYLLSQGMSEERVLESAAQALTSSTYFYHAQVLLGPPALTRLLLTYLPAQREKVQTLFQDSPRSRFAFISLVLQAQPADLDLVERLLEHVQEEDDPSLSLLGACAWMVLQADPARFTGWARKIASASGGANEHSRRYALRTLLKQDTAQHIDLAIEAARTPPANTGRWGAYLQCDGLQAAYQFDPARYQPLVEELTLSPSRQVANTALGLLSRGSIAPVVPVLKRCVEQGQPDAAQTAAQALFKQPWEGQEEYAIAQLAHPSKRLRALVGAWLAKQGGTSVELVAPRLRHRRAAIRLSAVQTLLSIGGERATGLLFSRLEVEQAQQIKQAIIDGIGLPGYSGSEEAAHSPSVQWLTAKSESYWRYLPKAFLSWFDLDEAPALRWITGEPVPPAVLNYLLSRQTCAADAQALHPEVQQSLTLIDTVSAGPLALVLYRGWLNAGAQVKHASLLSLIGALADDRLVPHLCRQIEEWGLTDRRSLAASLLRVLAQMESQTAHAEMKSFTKRFKRGYMGRAVKAALELAAAS